MMLAAGVYAAGLPLYLFFRVRSAALALGEGTEAIVALQDDQARRNNALGRAASIARHLVESRTLPAPDTLNTVGHFVAVGSGASTRPYATIPGPLRAELARSDEAMSRVGTALTEEVSLLRLGRWDEAGRRLRILDSLGQVVDQRMFAAGQLARRDLLDRQRALQTAASEGLRDTIFWLVLGALAVPLVASLIRRRGWGPPAGLGGGVAPAAGGGPAPPGARGGRGGAGRVAQHFNEMTRGFRDRAEEQGRFAAAGRAPRGRAART